MSQRAHKRENATLEQRIEIQANRRNQSKTALFARLTETQKIKFHCLLIILHANRYSRRKVELAKLGKTLISFFRKQDYSTKCFQKGNKCCFRCKLCNLKPQLSGHWCDYRSINHIMVVQTNI